jgi:hypothetical protein
VHSQLRQLGVVPVEVVFSNRGQRFLGHCRRWDKNKETESNPRWLAASR